MGLYLGMYLGPYVECVAREEMREVDVWGCMNASCPQHAKQERYKPAKQKFCAECSAPWGSRKKAEPYLPPPHTVLEGRDELTALGDEGDGVYYLGSNIVGPRRFECDVDAGGEHIDVGCIDCEEEMQWFRERFADDLAVLAKVYDTDVCWGLHTWYS